MTNSGYYQINSKECQYEEFARISDEKLVSNDGWTFNAHRYLLVKHSIFFRHLLSQCKNDNSSSIIPKVKGAVLEEVLYFINTKRVLLNRESFTELMMAADYLQIDELSHQLKIFSESILSADNCLKVFVASVKIGDKRLCQLSYRVIQTNFNRLLQGYEIDLIDIPVEFLKKILSDNSLRIAGENVIWDFIVKWINIDPSNRLKEVWGFLKCLKVGDIEESLAKEIIHTDIISKSTYCKNLKDVAFQKFPTSLDALKYIIDDSPESSDFNNHRLPSCLHLIVCYMWFENGTESNGIYVTYDEKVDVWRKLDGIETDRYFKSAHVIGSDIYVFYSGMNFQIFNLYEKEWREMGTLGNRGFYYKWLLTAKNNFYFISTHLFHNNILKFELYNTQNRQLFEATLMHPVANFEAASCREKIYVVGQITNGPNLSMFAQVYEEESNSWSIITPPSVYRSNFLLIVRRDKLYIIGGVDFHGIEIEAIEVFDTELNTWDRIDNLSFDIRDPLSVIDREDPSDDDGQCVLNEKNNAWEPTPIAEYQVELVYTISDRKLIKALVKESRDQSVRLKKSPFH